MSADPTNVDLPLDEPEAPRRETAESMRRRICQAYPADRYAVLFEVRNATGHSLKRRDGYCDAMVMGLWPSRGLELWGIEIKVSRSDWLRELKQPQKSEEFLPYCHRWYLVAPADVVKPDELPPTWGLMVPSRDGLRISTQAPALTPQPADVGLLASICRSAAGGWKSHPDYRRERDQIDEDVKRLSKARVERVQHELVAMAVKVAEFQKASGVTICDAHTLGDAIRQLPADHEARAIVAEALKVSDRSLYYRGTDRIGEAVKLVLDGGVKHMRDEIENMIRLARNVTSAAERSLAEFDAKSGST